MIKKFVLSSLCALSLHTSIIPSEWSDLSMPRLYNPGTLSSTLSLHERVERLGFWKERENCWLLVEYPKLLREHHLAYGGVEKRNDRNIRIIQDSEKDLSRIRAWMSQEAPAIERALCFYERSYERLPRPSTDVRDLRLRFQKMG